MPEIVWRKHVRNANLCQHPEGCGYTNQARQSGLKLLKPAFAGFVCVATPFSGYTNQARSGGLKLLRKPKQEQIKAMMPPSLTGPSPSASQIWVKKVT